MERLVQKSALSPKVLTACDDRKLWRNMEEMNSLGEATKFLELKVFIHSFQAQASQVFPLFPSATVWDQLKELSIPFICENHASSAICRAPHGSDCPSEVLGRSVSISLREISLSDSMPSTKTPAQSALNFTKGSSFPRRKGAIGRFGS